MPTPDHQSKGHHISGSAQDTYRQLVLSQNLYEEAARRIQTASIHPEITETLRAELNASYAYLAGEADRYQELMGEYGGELTEQQRKAAESNADPRELEIRNLVNAELAKAGRGYYSQQEKAGDFSQYARWRWTPPASDGKSPGGSQEAGESEEDHRKDRERRGEGSDHGLGDTGRGGRRDKGHGARPR